MRLILLFILIISAEYNFGQTTCCKADYSFNAIMDTVTVVVNGKITDLSTGKGIEGVSVVLENDLFNYQVVSNKDGNFRFYHISNNTYQLLMKKENYCSVIQDNLSFGSGWIVEMNICMQHSQ